jgi:hypothetical protein
MTNTVKDPLEKYELLGAIVGGFVLGFFIFGVFGIYLCTRFDLHWFISLAVAIIGAIGAAYSQVLRGDTLWKEITASWRWWWW